MFFTSEGGDEAGRRGEKGHDGWRANGTFVCEDQSEGTGRLAYCLLVCGRINVGTGRGWRDVGGGGVACGQTVAEREFAPGKISERERKSRGQRFSTFRLTRGMQPVDRLDHLQLITSGGGLETELKLHLARSSFRLWMEREGYWLAYGRCRHG